MKMRNLFALGLIGTALYAHKRYGGEWTLDSMRQSLMDLWAGIEKGAKRTANKTDDAIRRAEQEIDNAVDRSNGLRR